MSDGTSPVTLRALGISGNTLASFTVQTSATSKTPENGYWPIGDTSSDIAALEVISPSNLGIDDLQYAPEPSSGLLMGAGALLLLMGKVRAGNKGQKGI